MGETLPAPGHSPFGPASEFQDWMKFLDPVERDTMTLRFVEEWEYHEIAAARAVPIGTVQWRGSIPRRSSPPTCARAWTRYPSLRDSPAPMLSLDASVARRQPAFTSSG
jgi:hypothetical protein